jgi:hypothetical protein
MNKHIDKLHFTGKFSPLKQWGSNKLSSEEFKTINDKAKFISTSFLNGIATNMIMSSNAWVSNYGEILFNIFNASLLPGLNWIFGKSKILSGVVVGVA